MLGKSLTAKTAKKSLDTEDTEDTEDTRESQYNISTAKAPKNKSNSKFKKAVSAYEADIREALNKNPAEAGSAADSES